MLLTVLVAQRIFGPERYDSTAETVAHQYEYDFTAEMLMPAAELAPRKLRALA